MSEIVCQMECVDAERGTTYMLYGTIEEEIIERFLFPESFPSELQELDFIVICCNEEVRTIPKENVLKIIPYCVDINYAKEPAEA